MHSAKEEQIHDVKRQLGSKRTEVETEKHRKEQLEQRYGPYGVERLTALTP